MTRFAEALSRRTSALALALLLALPLGAAEPANQVKLAVIVAVDGLSWPTLERYRPWLQGGLRRLLDEGQVETDAHYAHLNTETGPGHASLGTGAPPRVHGIVANRWYEPFPAGGALRRYYCTDQADTGRVPGKPALFYKEVARDGRIHVFANLAALERWQASGEIGQGAITRTGEGPAGETIVFDGEDAVYLYHLRRGRELPLPLEGTIPGPANLRVPTLGDRLVDASPASQVVALSGKDRAAIFLAGRNPKHFAYWFDKETGRFVTSAAYETEGLRTGAMRDAVARFNKASAGTQLVRRLGTIWTPLPLPSDAARLPQPERDIERFQSPDLGIGFDHDLALNPEGYFDAVYYSPMQDQLLGDFALAILGDPKLAIGRRGVTDLLAISFSANDTVSHEYGPDSEEHLDALRRVDIQIGRVLSALDAFVKEQGPGSVVLALSADHGFAPIPEVVRRKTGIRHGGRITGNESEMTSAFPSFEERLNLALSAALCLAPGSEPVKGTEGWSIWYDHDVLPLRSVEGSCGPAGREITAADIDRALPQVMASVFGHEIAKVLLVSERARWDRSDRAVQFALEDFDPVRSGDVFLIPRSNAIRVWDIARGSGHGSHHDHDTNVPLIFWGGPFRASVLSRPAAPYDLAPTLGAAVGVKVPDSTGTSRLPAASARPAQGARR